jgi:hypothetical protein
MNPSPMTRTNSARWRSAAEISQLIGSVGYDGPGARFVFDRLRSVRSVDPAKADVCTSGGGGRSGKEQQADRFKPRASASASLRRGCWR